jgi:hypothetical protein
MSDNCELMIFRYKTMWIAQKSEEIAKNVTNPASPIVQDKTKKRAADDIV